MGGGLGWRVHERWGPRGCGCERRSGGGSAGPRWPPASIQTAGALVVHSLSGKASASVYFLTIDNARFRKPVVPGDTVHFHVKLSNKRPPVWKYWAEAMVDGKKVAEAEIGAMLMNERGV